MPHAIYDLRPSGLGGDAISVWTKDHSFVATVKEYPMDASWITDNERRVCVCTPITGFSCTWVASIPEALDFLAVLQRM